MVRDVELGVEAIEYRESVVCRWLANAMGTSLGGSKIRVFVAEPAVESMF